MPKRAALGFKVHTGWAMLVAIAGDPEKIEVLLRRRIELLPTDESIPRFVYHQAAELPLPKAAILVQRAKRTSQGFAQRAINAAIEELDGNGARVEACGVLAGTTLLPEDLSRILGSHPLIHAAEGALFVGAIASAANAAGKSITTVPEREVWARAAKARKLTEATLRREIDELRKTVGSPWSADHKLAAASALLALKS